MECTLVTTAHDESMTLKAMVESECSRCIVLYQHSFDKLPECSNEDIKYVKIEKFHTDAVKEIDKVLKELKNVKFYLANVHLDIYILYYLLKKKEDYHICILDNNKFMRMP
ncbi:hypothetical protein [Methanobacterium oryzae]|uniref:hypothetical protein n=1 Tax=Methanobacterium oryzae TaxID=69540 RepID=UPI003D2389F1